MYKQLRPFVSKISANKINGHGPEKASWGRRRISTSDGPKAEPKTSKRDWNLTLGRTDDDKAYIVRLNKIGLKTPMKNPLRITDETLALIILSEWKSAGFRKKLNLTNMHFTTLAYEAIDNPFNESQAIMIDTIMEYLRFDTLRFRDTDHEELLAKQSRYWDPLVGWFEHKFTCHIPIDYGNITSTTPIPNSTQEIVSRHLESHKRWPLVGLKLMCRNLKSYIIASALTEKIVGVERAVDLARLETEYQTEKWSKVEWEHDIDEECTKARVSAGTLFYHLSL